MPQFNAHLMQVLEDNRLPPEKLTQLKEVRQKIVEYIQAAFGADITPFNSGSMAKGTATKASDLDIAICFRQDYPKSVKKIYELVHEVLEREFRQPQQVVKRRVALKVELNDILVDVLPCKKIDDTHITMYNVMQRRRQRGSIKIHVDNARQYNQIIKLMKIWRNKHNIKKVGQQKFSGFALEQLVIRALNRKPTLNYEDGFIAVLLYIKCCINTIKLVDPANPENLLNMPFNVRQKVRDVANVCYIAYKNDNWNAII